MQNKNELLEVGKENLKDAQERRREKEKSGKDNHVSLSINDKDTDQKAQNPPPHNTQKAIAKTLKMSTGKVAQAEYVRKHEPEGYAVV